MTIDKATEKAVQAVLFPQGRDVVAERLGIRGDGQYSPPGKHLQGGEPGSAHSLPMVNLDNAYSGPMSHEDRANVGAYAQVMGNLLEHPEVMVSKGYHGFPDAGHKDGAHIGLSRHFTPEEADALAAHMAPSHVIPCHHGAFCVNAGAGGHEDFLNKLEEGLHTALPPTEGATLKSMAFDHREIPEEWEDSADGKRYAAGLRRGGRSDTRRSLYSALSANLEAVRKEYAERQAWGSVKNEGGERTAKAISATPYTLLFRMQQRLLKAPRNLVDYSHSSDGDDGGIRLPTVQLDYSSNEPITQMASYPKEPYKNNRQLMDFSDHPVLAHASKSVKEAQSDALNARRGRMRMIFGEDVPIPDKPNEQEANPHAPEYVQKAAQMLGLVRPGEKYVMPVIDWSKDDALHHIINKGADAKPWYGQWARYFEGLPIESKNRFGHAHGLDEVKRLFGTLGQATGVPQNFESLTKGLSRDHFGLLPTDHKTYNSDNKKAILPNLGGAKPAWHPNITDSLKNLDVLSKKIADYTSGFFSPKDRERLHMLTGAAGDEWMLRSLSGSSGAPTEHQYNYIQGRMRHMSKELNVPIEQLQAAFWVGYKRHIAEHAMGIHAALEKNFPEPSLPAKGSGVTRQKQGPTVSSKVKRDVLNYAKGTAPAEGTVDVISKRFGMKDEGGGSKPLPLFRAHELMGRHIETIRDLMKNDPYVKIGSANYALQNGAEGIINHLKAARAQAEAEGTLSKYDQMQPHPDVPLRFMWKTGNRFTDTAPGPDVMPTHLQGAKHVVKALAADMPDAEVLNRSRNTNTATNQLKEASYSEKSYENPHAAHALETAMQVNPEFMRDMAEIAKIQERADADKKSKKPNPWASGATDFGKNVDSISRKALLALRATHEDDHVGNGYFAKGSYHDRHDTGQITRLEKSLAKFFRDRGERLPGRTPGRDGGLPGRRSEGSDHPTAHVWGRHSGQGTSRPDASEPRRVGGDGTGLRRQVHDTGGQPWQRRTDTSRQSGTRDTGGRKGRLLVIVKAASPYEISGDSLVAATNQRYQDAYARYIQHMKDHGAAEDAVDSNLPHPHFTNHMEHYPVHEEMHQAARAYNYANSYGVSLPQWPSRQIGAHIEYPAWQDKHPGETFDPNSPGPSIKDADDAYFNKWGVARTVKSVPRDDSLEDGFYHRQPDDNVLLCHRTVVIVKSIRQPEDGETQWITVNGLHIPIKAGENKGDAVRAALSEHSAKLKAGRTAATGGDKKENVEKSPEQIAAEQKVLQERSDRVMGKLPKIHEAIPKLRKSIEVDLKKDGLSKERVGAVVSTIIDQTTMRIGSEEYATKSETGKGIFNENSQDSFGASSMRKHHVTVDGDSVTFKFPGKSKKDWDRTITDAHLAKAIKELQAVPGDRLMQYHDDKGNIRPFTEVHTNEYMGVHGISPKNIRTHHATEHADRILTSKPHPKNAKEAEHHITEAVESTSKLLGNSPAMAKGSYINPAVLATHRARIGAE